MFQLFRLRTLVSNRLHPARGSCNTLIGAGPMGKSATASTRPRSSHYVAASIRTVPGTRRSAKRPAISLSLRICRSAQRGKTGYTSLKLSENTKASYGVSNAARKKSDAGVPHSNGPYRRKPRVAPRSTRPRSRDRRNSLPMTGG